MARFTRHTPRKHAELIATIPHRPRLSQAQIDALETNSYETLEDLFGDRMGVPVGVTSSYEAVADDTADSDDLAYEVEMIEMAASGNPTAGEIVTHRDGKTSLIVGWRRTAMDADRRPTRQKVVKIATAPAKRVQAPAAKPKFHYSCTTCACAVVTKKQLDPNRPIYCNDCRPKRVSAEAPKAAAPYFPESILVVEPEPAVIAAPAPEPIVETVAPPVPFVTEIRAEVFTDFLVELESEGIKFGLGAPKDFAGLRKVAATYKKGVLMSRLGEWEAMLLDRSAKYVPPAPKPEPVVVLCTPPVKVEAPPEPPRERTIWERVEPQLPKVIAALEAAGFKFGLVKPRSWAELQARVEGSPKWLARNPVAIIEQFVN